MPSRPFPLDDLGPFGSRPRLVAAVAIGFALGLLLALLAPSLDIPTRAFVAWDVSCLAYVAMMMREISGRDTPYTREMAASQDPGQGAILAFVLVLAATSLAAVAVELSAAKDVHGLAALSRILLAIATVTISWFVTHLIFAVHYAHEDYAPDDDGNPATLEQGGLAFPGGEPSDYWDFVHFAVVIGVASQTADIAFTSKRMRRIGTVHGLAAFSFNTVILALTINILAGLL